MENSYSKSANQVLEIAREQAKNFHNRYIGTEHILLALVLSRMGMLVKFCVHGILHQLQ